MHAHKPSKHRATPDNTSTVGETTFAASNAQNTPLLSINAGVPLNEALEHVSCLMRCVTELTVMDALDRTATVHVSAAHYLSEMALAIIEDASVSLHRRAVKP
jgi:hypothetical protein